MVEETIQINAWLYTSEFVVAQSWDETKAMSDAFSASNQSYGITGFLISDGHNVMQYIEGGDSELSTLKSKIMSDAQHNRLTTHCNTSLKERAYPDWSLKAVPPSDYEDLFTEIEAANRMSLGVSIARMLFDSIFES
ncbi:hypothetical protein GCM10009069_09570 [Algimonas arctica]|uniref:BLUF domain-containing protein n=1 Tax=Algimonas arctica TaxID=1479486 RepID=A0A8J3G1T1_9PROT|nr:BLUF domain-containing protein [Algimonas arctica]GHA88662.1 hypothetical protein GCM10009069_09570 [Algimonas arctica]